MSKQCTHCRGQRAYHDDIDTRRDITGYVMESKPHLTSEPIWQKIQQYYDAKGRNLVIKELFASDPQRFNKLRWVISIIIFFNRSPLVKIESPLSDLVRSPGFSKIAAIFDWSSGLWRKIMYLTSLTILYNKNISTLKIMLIN